MTERETPQVPAPCPPEPQDTEQHRRKSRAPARIFGFFFYAFLIIVVLTAFAARGNALAAPRVIFGHAFMRVLSGSMQREIPEGSLIIVRKTDPGKLAVGDNITFFDKTRAVVTHKIAAIRVAPDGAPLFITRGTENPAPDPEPIPSHDVVGKVVFHTLIFAHLAAFAADIWDFLLHYPVFLVLFPALLIGLIIAVRVFLSTSRE
jgi:signal peptidase I